MDALHFVEKRLHVWRLQELYIPSLGYIGDGGVLDAVHLTVPVAVVLASTGSLIELRLVIEKCSRSDSSKHEDVRLRAVHHGI